MKIKTIFHENMTKRYYILFKIITIAIIIYIGVDTFYRVLCMRYVQVDIKTIDSQIEPEEKTSVKHNLNEYKNIIDRNIFSKVSALDQKGEVNIDELKSTSLNLTLLGTIAGDKNTSAAIIEDTTNRTQGIYRVGDMVQTAVIKSILREKVILKIGDGDEVLTMEGSAPGERESVQTVVQRETGKESDEPASAVIEQNINIKKSDVDKALKDLNELVSQVSVRPHSVDGETTGLIITGIKSGTIFRKMGLRNGDIITSVNGDNLETTEDLISMYNNMKSGQDISSQIIRRGKEKTMNYTFTD